MRFTSSTSSSGSSCTSTSSSSSSSPGSWSAWHLPPVSAFLTFFLMRRKTISIAAAPLPLSKDMPYFRLHNKFANHVLSAFFSSSSPTSSLLAPARSRPKPLPHRHQRRQRKRRAWHQVPVVATTATPPPPPPASSPAFFCALLCLVSPASCGHLAEPEKIRQQPQQALRLFALFACLPFGRFINSNLANRLSLVAEVSPPPARSPLSCRPPSYSPACALPCLRLD